MLYCCNDCKNVLGNYFCHEICFFKTSVELFLGIGIVSENSFSKDQARSQDFLRAGFCEVGYRFLTVLND